MTTDSVVPARPSTQLWIFPILFAMLVFPAMRAAGVDSGSVGVSLLFGAAAYFVAVYLFYGVARLMFAGQFLWLAVGSIGGAILGAVATSPQHLWFAEVGWLAVLIPGLVAGHLLRQNKTSFQVYLIGLVVLTLFAILAWYPTWREIYALGPGAGEEMVKLFVGGLGTQGYSPEQVEQIESAYKLLAKLTVRLSPALAVVSAIVQFSLGFLWLSWRLGQTSPALGQVRRFTQWKVPFGLTPVTGVVILARLVGNDAIQLVADNALLVLAIFYAVCGLSFMEFTLHRVKVSIFIRILFYLLLFLAHLAGLMVMVLIGFIDSFLDWRKLGANVTVEQ